MAKTSSTVKNFLEDLAKKLKPLGESDRAMMLKLKKEEVGLFSCIIKISRLLADHSTVAHLILAGSSQSGKSNPRGSLRWFDLL